MFHVKLCENSNVRVSQFFLAHRLLACHAVRSILICKLDAVHIHLNSTQVVRLLSMGPRCPCDFPPVYIQCSSCLAQAAASVPETRWSSQHRPLVRIIDGRYYSNDSLGMEEWNFALDYKLESVTTLTPRAQKSAAVPLWKHSLIVSKWYINEHLPRKKTDCCRLTHLSLILFWLALGILASVGIDDGLRISN